MLYIVPKTWKKVMTTVLVAVLFLTAALSPAPQAQAASKKQAVVSADKYRKTLTKGMLGKRYGTVIDGVSCDCSGYTKVVLERMESKSSKNSFKDVTVKARSTAQWLQGSTISYTSGVATRSAVKWTGKKTTKIGKNSIGTSSLSKLNLGDVVLYGHSKNSTSHIAVYFGEFSSATAVKDYLVRIGVYSKNDLKRVGSGRYLKYTYKGRTVIRTYGNSDHWRVHSTCSGIMIDNDIAGSSPYTSSFGDWRWSFESGITVR